MMLSKDERNKRLAAIASFPEQLKQLVSGLDGKTLITPFIENEWTIAQIVHHMADSHMNSYIRLKLILTEDEPPLKGYHEGAWGQLPDGTEADISDSLMILEGLHRRWVKVFGNLTEEQWMRAGIHSEIGRVTPIDLIDTYANHCEAHLNQIQRVIAASQSA